MRVITIASFGMFLLVAMPSPARADEWPDFPFIYAVGKAEREVPPDSATITFVVSGFNESPDAALEIVQKRAGEVIKLFSDTGIAKDDIRSYEVGKEIVRERRDYVEVKYLGYNVTQQFRVELKTLRAYSNLVDSLISMENVGDVNADFDVTNREDIERQLIAEASADAKSRAESMAKGLDGTVGSIYAISEMPFSHANAWFGVGSGAAFDRMFEKAMRGETILLPTKISLVKSINAIFVLRPKE